MTSTSENSEDIPVSVSERRAVLVNNAPQSVINGIGDVRRVIREKAIKTLTDPLDLGSIADIEVFYSLPLEFLAQGDLPGAIWYMQTI